MYNIVFFILLPLIIIVIGFWLGNIFSNKILPPSKAEFKIKDALKAVSNGNIEVWEQFKLLNSNWDNIISDYDLSNCNLSGVNFKGIFFKNVKFFHASLENADFSQTSMENVCFDEASLKSSNFSNSKILKSTFNFSSLKNSDFSNCKLETVTFISANLQNVNFYNIKGVNLNFDDANIKDSTFLRASLEETKIPISQEEIKKNQKEDTPIQDIINEIYKNPAMIYDINPITMEDVVAELFHFMGYTVQKTPMYKDGGYDLILNTESVIGKMTYFVEVKRYSPNRKIGIDLIRTSYGILLQTNNINGFIIVTTGSFSRDAIKLSEQYKQIQLIDNDKLMSLIKNYCEQNLKATSLEVNDFAKEYYNMGIFYESKQEYEKAMECYLKAVELKPDYTEALYEIIDKQIAIAEIDRAKEHRNELILRQARLSYRFPALDTKRRMQLLFQLAEIGEKQDIFHIEKVIQNEKESKEIKDVAKLVLDTLEKRYIND